MMLAAGAELAGIRDAISFHELHNYIPLPWENHRLFGAGFMLIAVVLAVETLAGNVWFRESWRRDVWPAVLVILGWGMAMVAIVDPVDRPIHLLIGFMMLIAGVAERRYRHGEISFDRANLFVVPALFAGGLEIGVFHSHGSMTSQGFLTHSAYGITAALLAPIRLYQGGSPQSMWRSALMAVAVFVLALELLGLNHGDNVDFHNGQAITERSVNEGT
jgi:hypothetical protein